MLELGLKEGNGLLWKLCENGNVYVYFSYYVLYLKKKPIIELKLSWFGIILDV